MVFAISRKHRNVAGGIQRRAKAFVLTPYQWKSTWMSTVLSEIFRKCKKSWSALFSGKTRRHQNKIHARVCAKRKKWYFWLNLWYPNTSCIAILSKSALKHHASKSHLNAKQKSFYSSLCLTLESYFYLDIKSVKFAAADSPIRSVSHFRNKKSGNLRGNRFHHSWSQEVFFFYWKIK